MSEVMIFLVCDPMAKKSSDFLFRMTNEFVENLNHSYTANSERISTIKYHRLVWLSGVAWIWKICSSPLCNWHSTALSFPASAFRLALKESGACLFSGFVTCRTCSLLLIIFKTNNTKRKKNRNIIFASFSGKDNYFRFIVSFLSSEISWGRMWGHKINSTEGIKHSSAFIKRASCIWNYMRWLITKISTRASSYCAIYETTFEDVSERLFFYRSAF